MRDEQLSRVYKQMAKRQHLGLTHAINFEHLTHPFSDYGLGIAFTHYGDALQSLSEQLSIRTGKFVLLDLYIILFTILALMYLFPIVDVPRLRVYVCNL